jgi:glycosyltransferase involved in cell wall biosynthesis
VRFSLARVRRVGDLAVSVVIPTRNRSEMLRELLDSLASQTLGPDRFEVVVVDNGSTDGTTELLEGIAPTVPYALRTVRQDNAGPASGRNRGWRLASAPLVAFTDDDCVATPSWLEALVSSAESRPGAIVQGRTKMPPGDADKVGPFSRVLEITDPNPWYATCNILYPRGLLDRLGGFNESFTAPASEDTDLGWRARESGAEYVFVPDAVVHHAVVSFGPIGKLRWAFRWSDAMSSFSAHPGLRKALLWGVFWKRSHALLLLALAGAAASRRFPLAALLALPYARMLRARCIIDGYSLGFMPYLALFDLAELLATVRGAARYRVVVL